MNCDFFQQHFNKRQIRQSLITLLVFFVSLFAHSEHFTQVEFEDLSILEPHDCHLCQQEFDSPPAPLELKLLKEHIFSVGAPRTDGVMLVVSNYVHPSLRAPPRFL